MKLVRVEKDEEPKAESALMVDTGSHHVAQADLELKLLGFCLLSARLQTYNTTATIYITL